MSKKSACYVGTVMVCSLFASTACWATDYYVDAAAGSDSSSGRSTTSPWRTVGKVNASSFAPGDRILFKRGQTWREQLIVPAGGIAGHPIIYGAYGSGVRPAIKGSALVTGWSNAGGSVWRASLGSTPNQVFFNGVRGTKVYGVSSVNGSSKWYWTSGTLYVYSGSDPDGRTTIEASVRPSTRSYGIVHVQNRSYVTIQSLDIAQSASFGLYIKPVGQYITADDCDVHDSLDGGLVAPSSGGTAAAHITVLNCLVHHNNGGYKEGDPGVATYHEGLTMENVDGFTIRGTKVYHNYMEGSNFKRGARNGVIEYCELYANDLINQYIEGASNIQVRYNRIYDCTYNAGLEMGLETNSYSNDGIKIYGNLFWGNAGGVSFWAAGVSAQTKNIQIYNNTFYNNWEAVRWKSGATDNYSGTNSIKDNLFWQVSTSNRAIWDYTSGQQAIGRTAIAYNAFQQGAATMATGANARIITDPYFVSASSHDFHLRSGSPCIDKGTNVGLTVDMDGTSVPQGSAPDIGADEYASGGTTTTYTLATSATNGTITRAPNQTSYPSGQTVTLTATADSGYTFSGWSGDLTGTTNPGTLVMDANKSVTAGFTYTGGSGSTSKTVGNTTVFDGGTTLNNRRAAPYTMPEAGQLQSLSIYHEAGSGQMLLAVYADSSGLPGSRLGVTNATTVAGSAGWQTVALPSAVSVSGGQKIWLAWVFENNPGVRAVAGTPGRANTTATWSGGMPSTFGTSTVANYIYSIYATYSPGSTSTSYTLTTSATNGTITRAPNQTSYPSGQTVTLTATPNSGYTFSGWSGSLTGTTNPATLTMDSDKSVTANFTANLYTLSINATNGSVTRSPNAASYTYGQVVTLQAVPDAGYTFTGWSGDASGTSSTTTVVMDANKTVTANFTAARYILTVSAVHGVVTRSPSQASYTYGQVVTLQAAPDPNYVFTGWSGDASGTSSSTTVTMDADKTVVANFASQVLDQKPPALTNCAPAPDAIQVPPNTLVVLHLGDAGAGVDGASVSIRVNGHLVQTGDVDMCRTDYGVCRRLGTKADYTYVFQPARLLGYSRKVSVAVDGRDLAGNTMPEATYSFATEMCSFGLSQSVAPDQSRVEQGQPATVGDGQGNLWVVWQAGKVGQRHIYAAHLAPDADAYDPAVQLSNSTGDHCNPALALDAAGTLYAVWQENPRGVWDIYLATSADGATWSAPKRIMDPTLAANLAVDQVHPAVSAGRQSSHLVAVAWQDNRAGNQDIYVARSTDAFTSATVARVTSDGADQLEPVVAIDGQDTVFVLWTDTRTGALSVYGAASNNGPWTNIPVSAGPGDCAQPALAVGWASPTLHMAWVNDIGGDPDIFYASSPGLPASPLVGTDIVDDTAAADQQAPALVVATPPDGTDHLFICWQDGRNLAFSGDTDLYCAEVSPGALTTNVLISDEGTNSNQSDVAMTRDGRGYPCLVWSDSAGKSQQIFSAGATYLESVPLAEKEISAAAGGLVGPAPESVVTLDDVSVAVPPQACPFDATISIRRIRNPRTYATSSLRVYDFGPSGLTFTQPVTITIPHEDRLTGKVRAYWFDSATNAFTSEGITNVQDITLASGLRALQFSATHFTLYAVAAAGRRPGNLPARHKTVPAQR